MPLKALQSFAWVTSVGLFLVLIFGFVVTDTGSGQGCGHSFPLCHGQFIPAFAFHTVIEFGHRSLAAIVGVLVFLLFLWAWRRSGRRAFLKVLATAGLVFVIVQAALGAADVLYPEAPAVLALHFGFSLIAFAAVTLLAIALGQDDAPLVAGRSESGLRTLSIVTFIWIYGVAYLGAYVAHRGIAGACLGWPACPGPLLPPLASPAFVVAAHRLVAGFALVLAVAVFLRARRQRAARPDLQRAAHVLLGAIVLETASGIYLVDAAFSVPSLLVHVALMAVLFTASSYLLVDVLAPKAGVAGSAVISPPDV